MCRSAGISRRDHLVWVKEKGGEKRRVWSVGGLENRDWVQIVMLGLLWREEFSVPWCSGEKNSCVFFCKLDREEG